MSDLLATSAATWRNTAVSPPVLPPQLGTPSTDGSPRERITSLRERHRLRRERAERVYADSRSPARGWPVADDRAVVRFVAALIRQRRRSFIALVVLNAMAAVAALSVPRLLGQLIDRVTAAGSAGGIGSLGALLVGGGGGAGGGTLSPPGGPPPVSGAHWRG